MTETDKFNKLLKRLINLGISSEIELIEHLNNTHYTIIDEMLSMSDLDLILLSQEKLTTYKSSAFYIFKNVYEPCFSGLVNDK